MMMCWQNVKILRTGNTTFCTSEFHCYCVKFEKDPQRNYLAFMNTLSKMARYYYSFPKLLSNGQGTSLSFSVLLTDKRKILSANENICMLNVPSIHFGFEVWVVSLQPPNNDLARMKKWRECIIFLRGAKVLSARLMKIQNHPFNQQ